MSVTSLGSEFWPRDRASERPARSRPNPSRVPPSHSPGGSSQGSRESREQKTHVFLLDRNRPHREGSDSSVKRGWPRNPANREAQPRVVAPPLPEGGHVPPGSDRVAEGPYTAGQSIAYSTGARRDEGRGESRWQGDKRSVSLCSRHLGEGAARTRSRRLVWKWCGSSPWCCAIVR